MSTDDERQPPAQIGTVRMVVESLRQASMTARHRYEAHCAVMGPRDPFVHVVVTLECDPERVPYHAGDEFDLTFGPAGAAP